MSNELNVGKMGDPVMVTPIEELIESSKKFDVVIPVQNRDNKRVQRCIDRLIACCKPYIQSIRVVDYCSKKPVKLKNCEVIRVENHSRWNKAHALNIGILKGNANYIMTLDCDMLLQTDHSIEIGKQLASNNFIIDTNVRRVKVEDISDDYHDMTVKSKPWHKHSDRNQLHNQANGGFQIYSRWFYNEVNGIMESMGFYSGAMDNYMFFMARIHNLNIIDISYPLLHQEHPKQKNKNFKLDKREEDIANGYGMYKARYLDFIIKTNILRNPEEIGKDKPSDTLLKKFLDEYYNKDTLLQTAINNGKKEVEIGGILYKIEKQKPNVLICVIHNYEVIPSYFVWELFNLFNHTRRIYPDTDLQQVNACDVNSMRNLSIKFALGKNDMGRRYKYLVMLDSDHLYPPTFLERFIAIAEEKNLKVLTGLTSMKKAPYLSTQFYKLQSPIATKENSVICKKPREEIIQIEASGPVGMLINTEVFNKIKFPYFEIKYEKLKCQKCNGTKTITENNQTNECGMCDKDGMADNMTGGDIVFCQKLKEVGIPIFLDLGTSFPHEAIMFIDRGKPTK